jgi:hypothetical protein
MASVGVSGDEGGLVMLSESETVRGAVGEVSREGDESLGERSRVEMSEEVGEVERGEGWTWEEGEPSADARGSDVKGEGTGEDVDVGTVEGQAVTGK